jgi:hypothetical protein
MQRWLLTILCLLASFVYLTRQLEPGEMTGMSAAQMAAMPGMERDQQGARPDQRQSSMARTLHRTVPLMSTPPLASVELMVSGPNAPPASSRHDHVGHCPFCFSAAFALEADGVELSFETQPFDRLNGPVATRPHLLSLGHADARAPPSI